MKELLKSISTELALRLTQISKTGIMLTMKLLIRLPDAPMIPGKYGAHGPCSAVRKSTTIAQTSDVEVIYSGAMKMIRELKPVITDIRGVSFLIEFVSNYLTTFQVALHMTRLYTFAPGCVVSSSTKAQGTLWDFMKTKNVTKTTDGTTETNLAAMSKLDVERLMRDLTIDQLHVFKNL